MQNHSSARRRSSCAYTIWTRSAKAAYGVEAFVFARNSLTFAHRIGEISLKASQFMTTHMHREDWCTRFWMQRAIEP